ncbi:uncharacterized protein B0H64DRAFT_471544 [Chaetomium fimeti]|uniref:Uncharacterized protein n=1 Tax=Chaetomium fimeti TaxID=1854472 RepID=A0AAE0LUQ6_9PEZI|nr:hypothetical protein B0H64DRAFT_471544 [Chaetomium fimeti]
MPDNGSASGSALGVRVMAHAPMLLNPWMLMVWFTNIAHGEFSFRGPPSAGFKLFAKGVQGDRGAVVPLTLLLLSTTAAVLEVLFAGAPACEEARVTVRSVVSLHVDGKEVQADTVSSSHEVELSLKGAVAASSQLVEVPAEVADGADTVSLQDVVSMAWVDCVVSPVQVVSRGTLAVLLWDGARGDGTVSPEVQLVEAVSLPEELDGECVPAVIPSRALVDWPAVPNAVRDTSTGLVPVGPTLTTVELGSGKGARLDRTDDEAGDPVPVLGDDVKPTVPPLPVGEGVLEFDSGNGMLPVETAGTLPVPRTPELKGTEVPIHEDCAVTPLATVWFVRGYGAGELLETAGAVETPVPDPAMDDVLVVFGNGNGARLEPVTRLVGVVRLPPVGEPKVLEFEGGKGAEAEEVPEDPINVSVTEDERGVLEDLLPPVTGLELPKGEGTRVALETSDDVSPVSLTVGPAVGPLASEELLGENGGVCIDVCELPGGHCTLVPTEAAPVDLGRLVELENGNGAEFDPVPGTRVPDAGTPVPLPGTEVGLVPVGPT